ncbi:MAG: anion permease [Bacteriovoracia bacterium]
MFESLTLIAVFFLAYINGANDNFKGVATLYGSSILSYRQALFLASAATLLGCALAVLVSHELAVRFSGNGLVAASVLSDGRFPFLVASGAAITVALATRFGMPISTTHSLLGALTAAGFMLGNGVQFSQFLQKFLVPLLLSPAIAAALAIAGIFLLKNLFKSKWGTDESCLCVSETVPAVNSPAAFSSAVVALPALVMGRTEDCRSSGLKSLISLPSRDIVHIGSAASVCAARAMNDAPKIAGLLLLTSATALPLAAFVALSIAMVLGGLLHSKRIADRISFQIASMNGSTSVWTNVVTSGLVIFASGLGLPVSTTHTSCGAIAGTGAGEAALKRRELTKILFAWIVTLPISMGLTLLLAILMK